MTKKLAYPEDSVNYRLKRFIGAIKMHPAAFADSIGISRQHLDNWITRGVKIPVPFLTKIVMKYPECNARWLLCGEYDERIENLHLIKPGFFKEKAADSLTPEKEKIFLQTSHIRESIDQMVSVLTDLQHKYDAILKEEIEEPKENKKKMNNILLYAGEFAVKSTTLINMVDFIVENSDLFV